MTKLPCHKLSIVRLCGPFRMLTCGIFTFLFLVSPLSAQLPRDTSIERISRQILRLITVNLDKHITFNTSHGMWQLDSLFNIHSPGMGLGERAAITEQLIQQAQKNWGVDFKLQYFHNSDPFFFDDDQSSQNTGYYISSRIRTGLEWEFLREGFFGNRNKVKQLTRQQQIEQMKKEIRENDDHLYFRYNLFIYHFNRAKIALLEKRRDQLKKELELLHQVYFLKGILYEDVLNAKARIGRMEVKIANYLDYNRLIDSTLMISKYGNDFDVVGLPVLEVRLEPLVEDASRTKLVDSIDRLETQRKTLQQNPVNDLSLKLTGYQNYGFTTEGQNERSYTSFGLSAGLPLEVLFNREPTRQLVKAESDFRKQFNKYELLNNKTEIVNYYYEYKYKLEQYVEFLYKEMLYQEKIRMEVVNQQDFLDIHRSLRMLKHMDVLRQVQLELLDLKQQMYLLLLKIYGKTHHRSIIPFVEEIKIADYYQRLPAKRAIAVDQITLLNYDPHFIKNYLLSNDFEQLIVQSGGIVVNGQLDRLRTALKGSGIRLIMMGASENIIQEGVSQRLDVDYLIDWSAGRTPNWVEQSKTFLTELKNKDYDLLAISSAAQPKVAVQLPVDYPYLYLTTACEMVSLKMTNAQQLKVIEPIVRRKMIGPEKLYINVNASRFKDRMELEGFIDQTVNVYGIQNIIIEGLPAFIELDAQAIAISE